MKRRKRRDRYDLNQNLNHAPPPPHDLNIPILSRSVSYPQPLNPLVPSPLLNQAQAQATALNEVLTQANNDITAAAAAAAGGGTTGATSASSSSSGSSSSSANDSEGNVSDQGNLLSWLASLKGECMSVCMCMYVCMYVCMCVPVCAYMSVYVCMYMYVCSCVCSVCDMK